MPTKKRSSTVTSRTKQRTRQSDTPAVNTQISYETQTILVVLLLFLFYPVGIILMWLWMKWPMWVKLLIMLPILCGLFALGMIFFFVSLALRGQSVRENRMIRIQQWEQKVQQASPPSNTMLTPTPTYTMPGY